VFVFYPADIIIKATRLIKNITIVSVWFFFISYQNGDSHTFVFLYCNCWPSI